jgi:formylmethanofuran:tetrahydromethanopterin formyltransferase
VCASQARLAEDEASRAELERATAALRTEVPDRVWTVSELVVQGTAFTCIRHNQAAGLRAVTDKGAEPRPSTV